MMERTPPFKVLNPEAGDSDFDSSASSEVYRIVKKHTPIREGPSKRLLELISAIVQGIRPQSILLFDPVSAPNRFESYSLYHCAEVVLLRTVQAPRNLSLAT